jgi:hypothetical protein
VRGDGLAIYGRDVAGRPIVRPRRKGQGAAVLIDGYEVMRGADQVAVSYADRSAVFAELRGEHWRGFRRPPGDFKGEWPTDPSAIPEALRAAGIDSAEVRSQADTERWAQVDATVRPLVKRWLMATLRGEYSAGLYLHGVPGSGKTTTLRAIAAEFAAAGRSACILDVRSFGTELRGSYNGGASAGVANALRDARTASLCLIDDLTAGGKRDADSEIDAVIDARLNARLPTVIADNADPSQWTLLGLHERVASRLSALTPIAFPRTDHRHRKVQVQP